MVVKNTKKTFHKKPLGFQENICFFDEKYLFFCKNLFKVEFRRSLYFSAKSPYASEGKINIFASQKHVFFCKNLFKVDVILVKSVFSGHA